MASFKLELFHSIVISRFQKTERQGLLRFSLRSLPHSVSEEASPAFEWWVVGSASSWEEQQTQGDLVLSVVLPAKLSENFSAILLFFSFSPLSCCYHGECTCLDFIFSFLNYLLSIVFLCPHPSSIICRLFAEFPLKIVVATLFESWYVLKCLFLCFLFRL